MTIEQIAEKVLPNLIDGLEKNEAYLKKLEKLPMNEETKTSTTDIRCQITKMNESLNSINKAIATRKH